MIRSSIMMALIFGLSSTVYGLTPKEVYKQASPGVVLILGSDDGKAGSGGTGSVIDEQGRIITNAHVVISSVTNKPFAHLYVFLKPDRVTGDNNKDLKRRYKAEVIAFDPADNGLDLALLRLIDGPTNLPKIGFTDPDVVDVGDQVVAIGHPEQGGLWTLTTGSVSTLIANYGRVPGKDVFQTEASVNRGNSGGPLLDQQGQMIGINTMIARQAADGVAITAVNFSLKSSVAVKWLQKQGLKIAYAAHTTPPNQMLAAAPTAAPSTPPSAPAAPAPQTMAAVPPSTPSSPTQPSPGQAPIPKEQGSWQTVKPGPSAPVNQPPVGPSTQPSGRAADPAPQGGNQPSTPQQSPASPSSLPQGPKPTPPTPAPPAAPAPTQEVVVKGKPLDLATAKPVFVTPKRPFQMDALAAKQMAELEKMMQEFRRGGKTNGRGMGLW